MAIRSLGTGLILVVVFSASSSHANNTTANWGAQISNGVGTAGIGMANGSPLANGSHDLILMGSFNITNSQIVANATNELFLMSHFTTFGSAHIGDGSPGGPGSSSDGYWTAQTTNSASSLGIQNKEMYYWVFDSSDPSNAGQYGIFTSTTNSSWIFPNDLTIAQFNTTDLSQVAHDMSGILFGSYGSGISRDGQSPLYNLAAVPEPSTWVAGTLVAATLVGVARRRILS